MPFELSHFIKNLMKKNAQSPDAVKVHDSIPHPVPENTLYSNISQQISRLESGGESALAVLYPALLSRDEQLVNSAAEAIYTYVESLDAPKIIKLSLRFREYTSMEWSVEWKNVSLSDIRETVLNENAYLSILRLGTFHPNGYFREKCMLALKDDETSFPYIALRLNDWAAPVRDTAYRILKERLPDIRTDTAIEMLPFIEQAKRGERYQIRQLQEVEDVVTRKILRHPDEISLDRIRDYIPATRRLLYKILILPDVLSKDAAHRLLEREKSGNEKALILLMIMKNYECGKEELDRYTKNKNPLVRKKALEFRYERTGGAWDGLEQSLLDKSGGIRSDVCYILRRHTSFDILSFYRSRLHTPDEAIAILGIGENGTVKDRDILAEYLKSDTPKILKYTMRALSSLSAAGFEEDYWRYLHDTNVTISRAAYGAICRSGIHYGAERLYRSYRNCENGHTGKYLLYLLIHEPSWQRLPYLLLLYDPDLHPSCPDGEHLQMLIRRALWSPRGLYTKITKKHADRIIQIMDTQAGIPDGLKKSILFDLEHITIV